MQPEISFGNGDGDYWKPFSYGACRGCSIKRRKRRKLKGKNPMFQQLKLQYGLQYNGRKGAKTPEG